MNNITLYFLLLVALIFSIKIEAQQPSEPIKMLSTINNHLTSDHVRISGTSIFIIPPPGYRKATDFTGLMKNGNTLIIFNELKDTSVIKELPPIERPMNNQEDLQIEEFKRITVNGDIGAYVLFKHGKNKAYGLVFGDSSYRVMLTATAETGDNTLRNQIINSLSTVFYKKN